MGYALCVMGYALRVTRYAGSHVAGGFRSSARETERKPRKRGQSFGKLWLQAHAGKRGKKRKNHGKRRYQDEQEYDDHQDQGPASPSRGART